MSFQAPRALLGSCKIKRNLKATYISYSASFTRSISRLYPRKTFCSLPAKYVCTCPGKSAFSEMYVWREYSVRGRRKSQTTPTTTRMADIYGGNSYNRRGSRRSLRIILAVLIVRTNVTRERGVHFVYDWKTTWVDLFLTY